MSDGMINWLLLQVLLPLGAPAAILLALAFNHGKVRSVGILDYFPTEGVGYFALTYMAAAGVVMQRAGKFTQGVVWCYVAIVLFLGLFLSAEISERVSFNSSREEGIRKRGQVIMLALALGAVALPFILVGDVYNEQ